MGFEMIKEVLLSIKVFWGVLRNFKELKVVLRSFKELYGVNV